MALTKEIAPKNKIAAGADAYTKTTAKIAIDKVAKAKLNLFSFTKLNVFEGTFFIFAKVMLLIEVKAFFAKSIFLSLAFLTSFLMRLVFSAQFLHLNKVHQQEFYQIEFEIFLIISHKVQLPPFS